MKLNNLLADLVVLNQKVYTLHWNVKGDDGLDVHKLTDDLYKGLTEFIDEVGEKIKMGGEYPAGTLNEILSLTVIKELKSEDFEPLDVVKTVINDLTTLENTVLAISPNHKTQPLFDEIFMFVDKQRYLFGLLLK